MTSTQIWMLCIILAMVFFMVLSAVWGREEKDERQEGKK